MLVVGYVVVDYCHLSAAYTGADVTHAVVVAYGFMLIVGVRFAGLCGIPHDGVLILGIFAHQRAATGGGNHLVAVERQYSVLAECAEYLTGVARAEPFGSVLYYRNPVAVSNLHDTVYAIRHTVERHRNDGLRLAACLGYTVLDGLLKQVGVHVPRLSFRVDEHRRCTAVCDRV